jgi:hypothetical protein
MMTFRNAQDGLGSLGIDLWRVGSQYVVKRATDRIDRATCQSSDDLEEAYYMGLRLHREPRKA